MTTYASRKFNRLFVLLIVIVLSPLAFSQNASNGEIKGTVFDPSNAVVPGAKVAITNLQTGVSTTTTTNASGIYDRLSDGSMPCDGAWPADRIALFGQWIQEGYSP